MTPSSPVVVTCWGTRGSVPSPGPGTLRHGGDTSCLEVRAAGRRYLFDAGTGLRALGDRAAPDGGPMDAALFLTHFHLDHVQGLPFCAPLYHPDSRVRVHGPAQEGAGTAALVEGLMKPAYFPVPAGALSGGVTFADVDVDGAPWTDGVVQVTALRIRHPGVTCGYRVEHAETTVVYLPDDELPRADAALYRRIVALAADADLLLHDAMYADEEYPRRAGWGHSRPGDAVRLAADAGARRLLLFHHAPSRTDDALDAMVDEARRAASALGPALRVDAAADGLAVALGGGDG